MKQLLFFVFLTLLITRTDAQEYPKAILPGDYPDPSIMRDGEDYYMTHSPLLLCTGIPDLALSGFNELGTRLSGNAGIRGFCHGSRSVEI